MNPPPPRSVPVPAQPIPLIERAIARQQLPTIRDTDVADRTGKPWKRGGERQRYALSARGEQHGHSLVLADPGRIVIASIQDVRRKDYIETIVRQRPFECLQRNLQQQCLSSRIGNNSLFDPVA